MIDLDFEYLHGQMKPHHPALLASFEAKSKQAIDRLCTARNVPYGQHPRCRFDVFPARGKPRATMIYIHAGYWQSRDKDQFAFLAEPLTARGIRLVTINYPLCPDATMDQLVAAVRHAVPAILQHAKATGEATSPLVIAGHSAGGHLAVELASFDWSTLGLIASPIDGIIAISGVYDLLPLLTTPLNDKLRLNEADARHHSVTERAYSRMPPAVFAVGACETSEFHRQSATMHQAWAKHGATSDLFISNHDDHFSILGSLIERDSPLNILLVRLLERAASLRRPQA